jgi:hypothetical protein
MSARPRERAKLPVLLLPIGSSIERHPRQVENIPLAGIEDGRVYPVTSGRGFLVRAQRDLGLWSGAVRCRRIVLRHRAPELT